MAELVKHITASVLDCGSPWSAHWVGDFSTKYSSQFVEALYNTLPVPTTLHYKIYVKEPGPYLFGGN